MNLNIVQNKFIPITKIIKAHGLRGICKIIPTANQYRTYWVKINHLTPERLDITKQTKNFLWIQGINTRSQAKSLIGLNLFVKRNQISIPQENYLFYDLIGLKALDVNHKLLGSVTGVFNFGASDIIELNNSQLIPFTKQCIISICLTNGIIVCDIPRII